MPVAGSRCVVIARIDLSLVTAWLVLVVVGIVMVSSATASQPEGSGYYLAKHCVYVLGSLIAVAGLACVPLRVWETMHLPCLVLALVLCALVLVPAVSLEINGSRRWVELGLIRLQPAEAAKFLMVVYLAGCVARAGDALSTHWQLLLKPVALVLVVLVLILCQPDFGSVVLLAVLTGGILFLGGARLRDFLLLAVLGGVALAATPKGEDFLLSGEKFFVPDAHVADQIVVVARTGQGAAAEDGISLFVVDAKAPGVTVTQLKTVDMTRRQCHVAFQDVAVPAAQVLGQVGAGWPIVQRTLDQAMAGLCAEMVGTGQQALDMAVAYAKERVQFGKPIGSFQAVKHKCVDMMVQVENARSLTYYAAWTVDENVPEARQAVPMAKAYCSDMCKTVTSEAIQVHGGIGFTWEHDMHLFYRRGLASEAAFGSAPVHREVVAQELNL